MDSSSMKSDFITFHSRMGARRMHYVEWGDSTNEQVLVCVHGLTRNARDFDNVAQALAGKYRVICPDIPGRGESDWLDSAGEYSYPLYIACMGRLIEHLGVSTVHWLGTSMGGLIGIFLAAQPKSPISRMLLNDIGPFLPALAIQRIGKYVGSDPRFQNLDDVNRYLREIHASFGNLSDDQWAHLAKYSSRLLSEGGYALHYDPAIGGVFVGNPTKSFEIWDSWDAIHCPVAVFRGAESDVLLPETAAEMAIRGPKAKVYTISGVGHVPALMENEQIDRVREWFCKQ